VTDASSPEVAVLGASDRRGVATLTLNRPEKGNRYNQAMLDTLLAEMTRAFTNRGTVFWRVESTQVETDLLRTGVHVFQGGRKHAHVVENGRRDFVGAVSGGATLTLARPRGWDMAAGGMVTGYAVPRHYRRSTARTRSRSSSSCASGRRRCDAWSTAR